jgi:hypothetical protein
LDQVDQRQAPIIHELTQQFPIFAPITISRLVSRTFESFGDAPVQAYLPVLVRRAVRGQLRTLQSLPADPAHPRDEDAAPAGADDRVADPGNSPGRASSGSAHHPAGSNSAGTLQPR